MAVSKKVIIIGDGAAGIMAANKLRFHSTDKELEITVIGNNPRHFYKPDGVLIPFGYKNYRKSIKPVNFLLNYGVNYLKDEVLRINADENIIFLKSGKSLIGDYIIIATGDRYSPEEIPGYEGEARHFFDLQRAMELREYIKTFQGGQVFIGSAGEVIQYPESLYEFAFVLESYLAENSLKDKTTIVLATPSKELSPDPAVHRDLSGMLESRGIQFHPGVVIKSVDPKNKEVAGSDGAMYKYSLLILVPPHRGQQFAIDSGIADEKGYVVVDPKDLSVKGNRTIFAIGDANNLGLGKSAVAAHGQASFVASLIISKTVGGLKEEKMTAKVPEFALTGNDTAFSFYDAPGRASRGINVNKGDFMLRWTSADTYFSTMLRGMI